MKPAFLIVDMQKAYFEGDSRKSMEGTEGFEILEELKIEPDEARIHKRYGNAFNKTDLTGILLDAGVDVVVISGYCAEHCVLSTYRGALNHDLVPVLLKNGVAGGDNENLTCVEKISDVVSYTIVSKMLENVGDSPV